MKPAEFDGMLASAEMMRMEETGTGEALARASDEELCGAYVLCEQFGCTARPKNLAYSIAVQRVSPEICAWIRRLAAEREVARDDDHLDTEGGAAAGEAETRDKDDDNIVAEQQEDHDDDGETTYNNEASVQACIDQCVMSGAVNPKDTVHRSVSSDKLVCDSDFEKMLEHMPWKIMRLEDLDRLHLFGGHGNMSMPCQWYITVVGVSRAWQEQNALGVHGTEDTMIRALVKRCGVLTVDEGVWYPEELVPVVGPGEEGYDADYWGELAVKGAQWQVEWQDGAPVDQDTVMQE